MAVGGTQEKNRKGNEMPLLTDSEYKEYKERWLQRLRINKHRRWEGGGQINRYVSSFCSKSARVYVLRV